MFTLHIYKFDYFNGYKNYKSFHDVMNKLLNPIDFKKISNTLLKDNMTEKVINCGSVKSNKGRHYEW